MGSKGSFDPTLSLRGAGMNHFDSQLSAGSLNLSRCTLSLKHLIERGLSSCLVCAVFINIEAYRAAIAAYVSLQ